MCNCNNTSNTNKIDKAKHIIARLWEKSRFEEKVLTIKKINNK